MSFSRFELSEREKFYKLMFDTLAPMVPIMLIDKYGRFIYASDAFLNDMGLPPEALMDKTAYDLVRENYYERSPSLKALAEGRDSNELCASRNGKLVFTETRVLRGPDGEIQYVLCHSSKPTDIQKEVDRLKSEISAYKDEINLLRKKLSDNQDKIVFKSEYMGTLMLSVEKVAKVDISVMLTGESGVGKDLIAKSIHEKSGRADKPFIPICIPIMSPSILESELFGYVEGAFTNATRKGKIGLFEAANGGTVFLDEVGDIPLETQVKLLRVLESREITRLGSTRPKKLDIRIISATNKDIKSMVSRGLFREDLLYRLGIINIEIKPLRERKEDIIPLAQYFLKRMNQQYDLQKEFSRQAFDILQGYAWPGNVRQLKNVVEQAAVLSDEELIKDKAVVFLIESTGKIEKHTPDLSVISGASGTIAEEVQRIERQQIVEALLHAKGNKRKAAESLGISRTKLYRKLNSM